jgi:cytochrome c-type biogenesis protein
MGIGTLGLTLLAGVLTVLSPCVLPLLPHRARHRTERESPGSDCPAAGLATSFVAIGLFAATIGFSLGLDTGVFRAVSAILLIGMDVLLLLPRLQAQFGLAVSPVSNWVGGHFDGFTATSLASQFGLGLVLGAVWRYGAKTHGDNPRASKPITLTDALNRTWTFRVGRTGPPVQIHRQRGQ